MIRKPTIRTGKGVSFSDTRKTAPRTQLRRVSRVNLSDDALPLDFIADHIEDHAARPDGKPPVPCFATSFSLAEVQVLENQNTVVGCPFDKLFGRTMAEIFGSARSLELQPFEGSDNAPSIFALCLSLLKLSLKSLDRLRCALVLNLPVQPGHKQLVPICIDCNDSIRFVEIDSNWVDSIDIGKFDGIRNESDELITEILDYDTIDFSSVIEVFLEGFRDRVTKMLPAIDCRNAQETIFLETCISPSLSDKEQSERSMPVERMIKVMTFLLGSCISTRSKPNACAGELRRYCPFDIVVNDTMQIKSVEMFAGVPSGLGYAIAYMSKAIESLDERFVTFDNYLQGSLSKHQLGDTTMRINSYWFSGGEGRNSSPA